MQEILKDIPGFEGKYQISNLKNVKSLARRVRTFNGGRNVPEKILSPVQGKVSFYTQYRIIQYKVDSLYAEVFGSDAGELNED